MAADLKTICFVTLEINPTTAGGVGALIKHTAFVLLRAGYRVILLLDIPPEQFRQFAQKDKFAFPNAHNLKAFSVDELNNGAGSLPTGIDDAEYLRSIRIARAVKILQTLESIDLLELYDYCGAAFHLLAETDRIPPLAIRLHNTIEIIAKSVRNPLTTSRFLHYAMERAQIALADVIFTPGLLYQTNEIEKLYENIDQDRVMVSPPNFVAMPPMSYAADSRDVVFFGRLSTFKGLDIFVQGVVLALKDAAFANWLGRVLIIGPEETVASALSLSEIKSLIPDQHTDRFVFVGRVEHQQLEHYLAHASMAVFANKMESFCYAAHELHTMGIPLILNDTAAFKDHFLEGEHAVFFDGRAADLARAMIDLASDMALRLRLSERGQSRRDEYCIDHYAAHLENKTQRRMLTTATSVSVLIFTQGDEQRLQQTLASLGDYAADAIILRTDASGLNISGCRFVAEDQAGQPALQKQLGDAIIGLRAGDVVSLDWLHGSRTLLAKDPKVGVVSAWLENGTGPKTQLDHLLIDHSMHSSFGLRRLIRIQRGLTMVELITRMHAGGEASLLLETRERNLTAVERSEVGVNTGNSEAIPALDELSVLRTDADRIDPAYLALADRFALETAKHAATQSNALLRVDTGGLLAAQRSIHDPRMCTLRARPDLEAGEIWLRGIRSSAGQVRLSWEECTFSKGWEDHRDVGQTIRPFKVARWSAWTSFRADDSGSVELLCGPFCGVVEITYRGKSQVVNLRRSTVETLHLQISDLMNLRADKQLDSFIIPNSRAKMFAEHLVKSTPQAEGTLVIAGPDSWVARTSQLKSYRHLPWVRPEDVLDTKSQQLKAASIVHDLMRLQGYNRLIVSIECPDVLQLVDHLCASSPEYDIVAVLPSNGAKFPGSNDYFQSGSAFAALSEIARRSPASISVLTSDPSMLAYFETIGCRTCFLTRAYSSPSFQASREGCPFIAIAKDSGIAPTNGHLLSAAIILRKQNPSLQILAHKDDHHAARVNAELGQMEFRFFDDLDDLAGFSVFGPAIVLASYPDAFVPDSIMNMLDVGFVPITGPALLYGAPELDVCSVPYWDDAKAVAMAATRTIEQWDTICEKIVSVADSHRNNAELELAKFLNAPPSSFQL